MKELKTLKDFKWLPKMAMMNLKAEAVKWVKAIARDHIHYPNEKCEVVGFIATFFNLTEEDLK